MPPLERYARFLTGHAWTVLVAVGVATAVLAAGMGRLRVSIDFEASLPANHPSCRSTTRSATSSAGATP